MSPEQQAIQAAIDNSNDPQVRQALTQYRDGGSLPVGNQAAMFALSAAYLAKGLPNPTGANASAGGVDSGYGTGAPSAVPSAPPSAGGGLPGPGPDNLTGTPFGGAAATGANSNISVMMRDPSYRPPDQMAAQTLPTSAATGAGGDNTDPYAPARAGAQGTDPNPTLPNRTPTNVAPPVPALPAAGAGGGSTVSVAPPPAAAGTGLGAQGLNTLYGDPTNQQGQQTALDQFLLSLGIDQNNPGLFGGALAKRLANVFMNTEAASGIGGVGKNWGTDALGGMADLANLIRTQGMGGVSNMGQQVMAALPGLAGANNSVADQQRLMNAALGLTSEGMNPYLSQGLAQQQSAAQTQFGRDSAGAIGAGQAPPTNYLSFLASKQNPAYQGILNLLSGGGR